MRPRLALISGLTALTAAFAGVVANPGTAQAIVDGSYSNGNNTRWAASIYQNGGFKCSGALIGQTWVLTARHCLNQGSSQGLSVRVDNTNLYNGVYRAANGSYQRGSSPSDIALLRLESPIYGVPTLGMRSTSPSVGQIAIAYGWGSTTAGSGTPSYQLKEASVGIRATNTQDILGGKAFFASRMSGVPTGGDSGGPVMISGEIAGIISSGNGVDGAAVTEMADNRTWIRATIGQ